MICWQSFGLLGAGLIFFPVYMYFCIKLGAIAYLRGKQRFEHNQRSRNEEK